MGAMGAGPAGWAGRAGLRLRHCTALRAPYAAPLQCYSRPELAPLPPLSRWAATMRPASRDLGLDKELLELELDKGRAGAWPESSALCWHC